MRKKRKRKKGDTTLKSQTKTAVLCRSEQTDESCEPHLVVQWQIQFFLFLVAMMLFVLLLLFHVAVPIHTIQLKLNYIGLNSTSSSLPLALTVHYFYVCKLGNGALCQDPSKVDRIGLSVIKFYLIATLRSERTSTKTKTC
ncbi:CLUMA_CG008849, isoform A [Clunio marinus]|uniref:CLUMA_CG008849, isoform A n=1 Tax=Clunio marinus TaxID=568069 RepID=A0A1J1I586_9DIPT|nr:CLUMA_CG008849, isoform A [Clunio marinus]